METNDRSNDAGEVRDSEEQSENNVQTQQNNPEKASIVQSEAIQSESAMDTIEVNMTPEKVNLNEVVESLVRNKQAHFKSQQRGDPDLSIDEKKVIAENIFNKSPSGFLSRFGHLLSKAHLDYFHSFQYANDKEKEEVLYQLSYLGASSSKSSKTKLKNRRFDALQKMIDSGSYFSLEEMQARNPLLFEQLVGQYQTEEEKQTQKDDPPMDNGFSWMEHFAEQVEKERMEKFKEQQKLDETGDDDDSSDEADKLVITKNVSELSSALWGEYRGKFQINEAEEKKQKVSKKKEKNMNPQNVTEEEKAFYLQEFRTAMYHSFLSGNDKDFDYSSVDNNSEYDCVDMRERDEQDQYFDEESPDSLSQADMDVSEVSQDKLTQHHQTSSTNPEFTSPSSMDEDEDNISNTNDRLTEEDVQNLKTFASSWMNNPVQSKSKSVCEERSLRPINSKVMDVLENSCVSTHKVPIKKNHKIKIALKTKEM